LHAVNGILKQISKENNFKPNVYITGGLGKIFREKIIYKPIYMEYLTLEGIKEIGNKHFYG
jgi:pantothenate kinase type III